MLGHQEVASLPVGFESEDSRSRAYRPTKGCKPCGFTIVRQGKHDYYSVLTQVLSERLSLHHLPYRNTGSNFCIQSHLRGNSALAGRHLSTYYSLTMLLSSSEFVWSLAAVVSKLLSTTSSYEPYRIRTCDLRGRNPLLYSTELKTLAFAARYIIPDIL